MESCRRRVIELEREEYGAGARGALAQIASEGRLPEPARAAGRTFARRGRTALVVTAAVVTVTTVLVIAVVIAVIVAVLG